jgi:DeoR/GlpR family transcriptional regulator of sugar metabolism
MIPLERHERILEHLNTHRFLNADQAHALLGASPATIRRDFNELADRGLAQRTRGGLRRLDFVEDGALPYAFRAGRYAEEKERIARRAAELLEPGETVFVDGGTSTHHLARHLPSIPLTFITNSLRLAPVLAERSTPSAPVRVILSGGTLHAEAGLLMGPQAVRTLSDYLADWAFISPGGLNERGLYNTNEDVAALERVMIANARQTAVLAHPGKLGRTALCRVAGLETITRLITVQGAPGAPMKAALETAGVKIDLV